MLKDKETLRGLADNEALFEAVKSVVLEQFAEVPYAEGASDELLGQITRARYVGRQKVEAAFSAIAQCKTVPEVDTKDNPAY